MEVISRLQVYEFSEGESSEVVAFHYSVQLGVLVFQSHHARAGEYNLQFGQCVVALSQLLAPVWLFEHLVDEQHTPTTTHKLFGKLCNAFALEVEVVHINVEHAAVALYEFFFGILQEECCLSHATCSLYANEPVVPVDLVHQPTANGSIGVLYKIGVCAKECIHVSCLLS